ncbi:hypothetical protein DVK06_17055, partial [Halorubrum sp. Atlit-28R]
MLDMSSVELIEAIQKNDLARNVPIILFGLSDLPEKDQDQINEVMAKGVVKAVQSHERLLDET